MDDILAAAGKKSAEGKEKRCDRSRVPAIKCRITSVGGGVWPSPPKKNARKKFGRTHRSNPEHQLI